MTMKDWIGRIFGCMTIPRDRLTRILDAMDTDRDGEISLSEFVHYLRDYTKAMRAADRQSR